ncbi:MAG: P-II family nitrogen regulator [Vallitalea sp.]|nr:P-II family nitrogen regulator [Vallitalea sp.]
MTKIDIITRPSKVEELKVALNEIGITGMTFSHVLGCGQQKGKTEYYRGSKVSIDLLPKSRIEVVVCEVPVEDVVETAKKVLKTGEIGDGKIFIYPVENVIKIRTGEEGVDAL